ncbi:MAG: DUF1559 domain-containing protein [Planctomycetaceae bacterium]|nr:DUF1559 domain-containing protein [Planctomycetaceae bacterium]
MLTVAPLAVVGDAMTPRGQKLHDIRRNAAGFTLLELSVVIGIIGALIALLLPAVQQAREAARRLQCSNNVRQLAVAALNHEATQKFFPAGGWDMHWLGDPSCGFGRTQPGGWIYNILPFIEQQPLHDLGTPNSGMTIQEANALRIGTPLSGFNCPTRRPAALYALVPGYGSGFFKLTVGTITSVARSDYAINGGDYAQWRTDPACLDNMSMQTGICFQRSEIRLADITDGLSNTFLIGEKYINAYHYEDGQDKGDDQTMYSGDDRDLIRWTGIDGAIGTPDNNNRPRQDNAAFGEGNHVQWFGSAHADTFNMSFCDGSIRTINYSIDVRLYRRLGNRQDGPATDTSQF